MAVALSKVAGFERIGTSKKKVAYLAMFEKNKTLEKSFGNLPSIFMGEIKNVSPLDILNYKYLVISNPEESVKALSARVK